MISQLVQAHRGLMADTGNPESLSAEVLEQHIARARELESEACKHLDHLALMRGAIQAHAPRHPGDTMSTDPLKPGFDVALAQLESIRSGKGKEWQSSLLSALAMRLREKGDEQGALRALSCSVFYRLSDKETAWLRGLARGGSREAGRLLETYTLKYVGSVKLPPTQYPRTLAAGPGDTVFVGDRLGNVVHALNIRTGKHRTVVENKSFMNGVRVQDGRLAVCNTENDSILFFDADTLRPLGNINIRQLVLPLSEDPDAPELPCRPYHCLRHAGEMHVVIVPSSLIMRSALLSYREEDPAGTARLTRLGSLRLTDLMVIDGRLTGVNLTPGFLVTLDSENRSWRYNFNGPQGDIFYCSAQLGETTVLAGKHRVMRLAPTGEMVMHRHSDLVTGLKDTYPVDCALLDMGPKRTLCLLDNNLRSLHLLEMGDEA